jgi:MFS family permease
MEKVESKNGRPHFLEPLKISDIRYFIGGVGFFALGSRALLVVIGFQVYQMTHSAMALGWLGLIEAIPALSLGLFGGYAADHFNRRKILLITRAVSVFCALAMALLSWQNHGTALIGLYFMIFAAGVARGFADPAGTAFEAQVVPRHLTVTAASWVSSTWLSCAVIGPAVIGFVFEAWGAKGSYLLIAGFFAAAWVCVASISPKPQPPPPAREPLLKSLTGGWKFVFSNQPLFAALALDLFAVLFGGVIAILPIFADQILHVGARELGLLNAAPMLGALLISLAATHWSPIGRAGRNLLLAVAGFGICMIVFAFSKNLWLSMGALFLSGVFDGVSVVIRRSMVRLLSPEHLRGRIAAANWVFICASNELGAFESGMLAAWIGAVPCVAVGGFVTLGVVAITASLARQLRNLRFNSRTLEQQPDLT